MNSIVSFRLCKLSDDELLQKVDSMTDNIYESGKIPSRHIPARPDDDYDLLVGELIVRFKSLLNSDQNVQDSDTRDVPGSNAAKSILPSDLQKDFKEQLEKAFPTTFVSGIKNPSNHSKHEGANWSLSYFLPIITKLQERDLEWRQLADDAKEIMNDKNRRIEKLQEENKALKAWKESAISVMPDYQEIGKLLNVPLGQSVHDKIIPAIKKLQQENEILIGKCNAIESACLRREEEIERIQQENKALKG